MTKAAIVRRYPRRTSRLSREPFSNDLDRIFNEFVGPRNLLGRWVGEGLRDAWMPAVDIEETETSYVFTAELPGLEKSDVEITLEDNILTVAGERTFSEEWVRAVKLGSVRG